MAINGENMKVSFGPRLSEIKLKPKVILSAVLHYHNEVFKFWLARILLKDLPADAKGRDLKKFDEIMLIGSGKGVTPVKYIKQMNWKSKNNFGFQKVNKHLNF